MPIQSHRPVFYPYEHCATVEAMSSPPRVFILSATTVEALRSIMATAKWSTRWAKETAAETRQWTVEERANISRWGETLIEELMMPIDFCTAVANCIMGAIGTGNAVDIALWQYITQSFPPSDAGWLDSCDDNILAITGCDLDNLFAQCRQLTQLINALIMDLFQRIEQATNNLEAVSIIFDWVPMVGTVVEAADWVFEVIYENYEAEYTVEVENDIACTFFCAALRNDCQLTWTIVTEELYKKVWEGLFFDDFAEVVAALITLSPTGTAYVFAMFSFMASVLRAGGSFVNLSLAEVTAIMASIANDSDGDWATLCDCKPWHATFDLAADMSMFDIEVGQWISASGIHTENDEESEPIAEAFRFNYDFDTATNIYKAQCTVTDVLQGTWSGDTGLWAIAAMGQYDSNILATRAQFVAGGTGDYASEMDTDVEVGTRTVLYLRTARGYMDGHATVSTFELWGYGNPGAQFIADATDFEWLEEG